MFAEDPSAVVGLLGIFSKPWSFRTEASSDRIDVLKSLSRFATDERSQPSSFCGDSLLLNRSYLLPARFPFPPIRLVMERMPRTCDLYQERHFCSDMEADKTFEPEYHVREAFASFLDGCHWKSCLTLDLGANNGWFTAYALSLGSHVIAVEPQEDLAGAIAATIKLNCWIGKGIVVNAWAEIQGRKEGLWRAAGARRMMFPKAPVVPLKEILLTQAHFQLVKMDADRPEGRWLEVVDELLSDQVVKITTLVVECNGCKPALLQRFQQVHGYDVYLLDMHIDHRFLDAKGFDIYSQFGNISLPRYAEEMYSIRFLRHVYHLDLNMTLEDWEDAAQFAKPFANQYILTKERLVEPRREHPQARAATIWAQQGQEFQSASNAVLGSRSGTCFKMREHNWQSWTKDVFLKMHAELRSSGTHFGIQIDGCGDPEGPTLCVCVGGPCTRRTNSCHALYCHSMCLEQRNPILG